jgi:hypothetical protein
MVEQLSIGFGGLALVIAALSLWQNRSLKRRLDAALGGGEEQTLEATLGKHFEHFRRLETKTEKLTAAYHHLSGMAELASQKISVVRFNPFGDTGGDQSFCLAVLDAQNSGYVMTSIHGREGTRVYVKPIDLGKSKYTLSVEEKQAIAQATKRVPNKAKQKEVDDGQAE